MQYITETEFNDIKESLKPHQELAKNLSKNPSYGVTTIGYIRNFDITAIKEIGDKIRNFSPDKNRNKLVSEYNSLLERVFIRSIKASTILEKIDNDFSTPNYTL